MTPEIKAAIEREAEKLFYQECDDFDEAKYAYKKGAEYGYKLGLLVGSIKALENTEHHDSWNYHVKKLQELL